MSRTNSHTIYHRQPLSAEQRLRRATMATMLWENNYYVDGKTAADELHEAAQAVSTEVLAQVTIDARDEGLRHVALQLCIELVGRRSQFAADTINNVVRRADELSELLALYWRDGRKPLAKQLKRGLARAFNKFDAYQLAKYNRDEAIKLRDVMFLVHPKPKDEQQKLDWLNLVAGTLSTPDTWEVAISAEGNKAHIWERLLQDGKLGYLALLRNLRNMQEAGVDMSLMSTAILARKGADKVVPFRYVAAARACPAMEPALDIALCKTIDDMKPMDGYTIIMVDVSHSMSAKLSDKSDLSRMDAAATLASMFPAQHLRVVTFSDNLIEVPARRGMAGVDAIKNSQPHRGTAMSHAITAINQNVRYDRIIVITDEESTDGPAPNPIGSKAYMVNVAINRNSIEHAAGWQRITGFSENIIRWIEYNERSG